MAMALSPVLDGDVWWLPMTGDLAPSSRFAQLPAELRLRIWNCAVEPRVVPLNEIVHKPLSHRLPAVTQVNVEARHECREVYEKVGRGSYFDFTNDILLCDFEFENQTADSVLENMAPRVQRAVFWDCIPDDRICGPADYAEYLSIFYRQSYFGEIFFNELWFPNVKELWLVKVADIDEGWKVRPGTAMPFRERHKYMAKEFRYWVDEHIIEIAPLDWDAPDTQTVLNEGTCARGDCRTLNSGREHIISKVNFLDGEYRETDDGREWARVQPPKNETDDKGASESKQARLNRLRWLVVERTLTLLLRCEWPTSDEGEILVGRTKP